jgi:cob(I)alamin adenosyltransferase
MASKFAVALPTETMSATSLGAGEQRPMDDFRIDAYGVIDEANSAIGLARVAAVTDPDCAKLDAMLLCVQNDLFDRGADLFMLELNAKLDPEALRIIQSQVDRRERKINELNAACLSGLLTFVRFPI